MDEDFAWFEYILERKSRAAAPVTAAPTTAVLAQHTNTDTLMRSMIPELRGVII